MAYKYIYIDDLFDQIELGTINGLQIGEKIVIEHFQPNLWEEIIEILIKKMPETDGLLLDLRLEVVPFNEKKQIAKYKGSTLAQELRTLTKEKVFLNDFPIVLISGDAVIEGSLDQTSFDLFEAVLRKEDLGVNISFLDLSNLLSSFAKAYKDLNSIEIKSIENVLKLNQDLIDFRFLNGFSNTLSSPNHIISRFVLKNILQRPSFLINEDILAARLGVDKLSKDWEYLSNEFLREAKYQGLFSDYYKRWFMPKIEEWWEKNISDELVLRSTSAEKRVELMNSKLNLNLTQIIKDDESKSSSFWTVCKVTRKPIDTIDGFLIENQDDSFPWQDKEYICLSEALRELNLKVAPIEKNRLQSLKDYYGSQNKRVKK